MSLNIRNDIKKDELSKYKEIFHIYGNGSYNNSTKEYIVHCESHTIVYSNRNCVWAANSDSQAALISVQICDQNKKVIEDKLKHIGDIHSAFPYFLNLYFIGSKEEADQIVNEYKTKIIKSKNEEESVRAAHERNRRTIAYYKALETITKYEKDYGKPNEM